MERGGIPLKKTFLFPALAGVIYGSFCKAENEISKVVHYKSSLGEFEKYEFSVD